MFHALVCLTSLLALWPTRLHFQESGRASSRRQVRRGLTAAGGTPQGTPSHPRLACTGLGVERDSGLLQPRLLHSQSAGGQEDYEEEQEAKRRKTHAAEEAARLEFRSLLAVPLSRRTAEHESRLNAVTQLLRAASKRKRKQRRKKRLPKSSSRHPPSSDAWTLFHEPFVLAVLFSVSSCCSVQQRIQSTRQFSEALDIFHIFYVFLDLDPEVVPESGHSSAHPWYLVATGSVCAQGTQKN